MDNPGTESRCGRDFRYPSRQALGTTPPPVQWVGGLCPGRKAIGTLGWTPTPLVYAEVEGRVELYLYIPFWAFMAGYRTKFYFT